MLYASIVTQLVIHSQPPSLNYILELKSRLTTFIGQIALANVSLPVMMRLTESVRAYQGVDPR